nr:HDOD domain-containing protein [uncultured Desulfuromonas sp.]
MSTANLQIPEASTILAKLDDLPQLPDIAAAMLRLLNQQEHDTEALARIIASDPVLAARVLRVANSSYYGFSRQIKTILDATVLLGQKTLRNLVLTMALKGVYRLNDPSEKMLWEESMAHALGSQFLSTTCGLAEPEEAFLAGLLANIGELIFVQQDPQEYHNRLGNKPTAQCARDQISRQQFPWSFSQIGAAILTHWQFSPELVLCTLYSCQPQHPRNMATETSHLAHLVFVSRCLCCQLHIGNSQPVCHESLSEQLEKTALSSQPIDVQHLQDEFNELYHKNVQTLLSA